MTKQPPAALSPDEAADSGSIYRAFVALLRTGGFKPGDKLPTERDLARRFQTGRGTLRNALLMAQRDGLVTRKIGSGTYLSAKAHQVVEARDARVRYAHAGFHALLEARLVMEPGVAALAAEHHSEADRTTLRAGLASVREAPSWLAFKEALYDVFCAMYRASGNEILTGAFDGIVRSRRAANFDGHRLNSPVSEFVRQQAHDEIRVIVDAVLARDAETARRETYGYLSRMQATVTL